MADDGRRRFSNSSTDPPATTAVYPAVAQLSVQHIDSSEPPRHNPQTPSFFPGATRTRTSTTHSVTGQPTPNANGSILIVAHGALLDGEVSNINGDSEKGDVLEDNLTRNPPR